MPPRNPQRNVIKQSLALFKLCILHRIYFHAITHGLTFDALCKALTYLCVLNSFTLASLLQIVEERVYLNLYPFKYFVLEIYWIMLQFWLSSFDMEIKYQNRYTVENYKWYFRQFLSMSLNNLRNVGNPFAGLSGKRIEELQLINQRHYCYVQLCKCLS